MERIKCEIREASRDDRGMLILLAEETLHPLAEYAGHPERYHTGDVVGLLDRADVFVAQCGDETGGFVAVETDGDACAVRCICVNPGFEARGVANQLLDWVEGLAIERRLARLVARRPRVGRAVAAPLPRARLQRPGDRRGDARAREAAARDGGLRAPMRVSLIAVPYDLGRADVGSGRGPAAYLKAGAAETLRARGHEVEIVTVRREAPFTDELQAVLDVDEAVAVAVDEAHLRRLAPPRRGRQLQRHARRAGRPAARRRRRRRPSCGWTPTATSTRRRPPRPATSTACRWRCSAAAPTATRSSASSRPSRSRSAPIVHAGGREFDREELDSLLSSAVVLVDGGELRDRGPAEALAPALDALAAERRDVAGLEPDEAPPAHLHVDLDVLDPAAAPGVTFPSPHGLSAAQLLEAIDLVRERFTLVAVTVTSFTPDRDEAGTTLAAGLAVLQRVTTELARRP